MTNPIVGLIVPLGAMRIRDLVVLVVFVDEVQQNRTALEKPDRLAAGLVRDGRDLKASLAGFPTPSTRDHLRRGKKLKRLTLPLGLISRNQSSCLEGQSVSSGQPIYFTPASHLLCVLGQIYGGSLFDLSTQSQVRARTSAMLTW